jgi:hypothetical protein
MPNAPHIHRWYCTASWARRRAHQLMIEPLCRLCLEAGRVTPATVADHVTPSYCRILVTEGIRRQRFELAI